MRQRPGGVTILAVLAVVLGLLGLCGNAFGVMGSAVSGVVKVLGASGLTPGKLFFDSIIGLVISAATLVFGVGAMQLKPWAWYLGLGIEAVAIVQHVVEIARKGSGGGNITGHAFGIVIALLIIAYLLRGHVQEAFAVKRVAAPTRAALR